MNSVKRAITSVIRRLGKTTILLVIVFILGNVIAGAVSVQQAVGNADLTLRAKMSPVASISIDQEKFIAMYTQNPQFSMEPISVETIEKIGALPYIKYFDYSIMLSLESPSGKRYSFEGDPYGTTRSDYFTFIGVNNPEIIDIEAGLIRLVSGRTFAETEIQNLTYVAVISQEVANINNWGVGSVMVLDNNVYADWNNPNIPSATQRYAFEIIGIFEPIKQPGSEDNDAMYEELENRMYTSNCVLNEGTVFQINESSKTNPEVAEVFKDTYYGTVYVLKDPADLEPFRADVAALVPEYYMVKYNVGFDQVQGPLQSIKGISTMVLYIAIGATVLTMSLLITLFLRDRRRETGIYLALGERKINVTGQIFMEVIVVAMIAMTLSLFSGSMLSGGISDKMLTEQIADQANISGYNHMDLEFRGYRNTIDLEGLASSYAVSLNVATVLLFYLVGFATVCASVLLPIFYITRLNPKKILMGGEV